MGWLNRVLWIFVSPSRTFADVREGKVKWWEPWIVQAILATVAGYIAIPAQRAVLELNAHGATPEQLEQTLGYFDRFKWAQLAVVPPMMLLVGLALAGITYVLVTMLSSKANFDPLRCCAVSIPRSERNSRAICRDWPRSTLNSIDASGKAESNQTRPIVSPATRIKAQARRNR